MAEQNLVFNIYKEDGTSFNDIAIKSSTYTETVMSLDNNIEGYFYYPNNNLVFTYKEYITYKNVKYYLKIDEPPTIVRKGLVEDDSETAGMTKYTIKFFHPMVLLYNIPFTDVAVSTGESKYKSEDTTFSWIGTLTALVQKINKCLEGTLFTCQLQPNFVDNGAQSDVISFDNQMISDVLKTTYEKFKVPFVVDGYNVFFGTSSNEIYKGSETTPYIFKMGQGLGLKDNDRTPKNNTIITRIACYGSDSNIPNGYPKIAWTGNQTWNYTLNNDGSLPNSYPIIDSVINGVSTRVINHPFTRKYLMPTVYVDCVNKKVNPLATGYNPNIELIDYYDAVNDANHTYPNQINLSSPSYQKHQLEKIKPSIVGAKYNNQEIDILKTVSWINDDGTTATNIDDGYNSTTGKYNQGYFKVSFYPLGFDLYAMAAVTSAMSVNPTSGACNGCKFELGVDWDVVKTNFYYTKPDGTVVFDPTNIYSNHRDYTKFPDSTNQSISVILKKDTSTFGTLMPNIYQQPIVGDKFVFIGIDLPQYYITQAQTNLDEGSKQYMLENNIAYFEYPFTFDEYFLTENQDILAQIKSNSILRFEYGGENIALSIKELTIQWGDKALPEYKITLTDDVSISLNKLGQVTEGLSQLGSQVASIQASYDINITDELNKRVSKIYDDTVNGKITFKSDISVGGVLKVNSLTSGKIPYNTTNGLVDSPLYTDRTNVTSSVNVTAPTFTGDLIGNANTATKLQTPRSIFGQTYDGTSDVTGASYHTLTGRAIYFGSTNQHSVGSNSAGNSYIASASSFFINTSGTNTLYVSGSGKVGVGILSTSYSPAYTLDVVGNMGLSRLLNAAGGGIFYGQDIFPTNVGSYVLNYVSPTYGPRVLAYDGMNYQKLSIGKLISGTNFQLELNTDGTSKFNGGVIASGIESSKGGLFYGQYATMPSGLGTYVANYVSDAYGARVLAYDGAEYKDLKLGAMPTSGVFGMTLSANGDTRIGYNIGTSNFVSRTTGWQVNAQGAAEFRNIYADELRVQAFTADISQALAGSDYLTKSVSKLSANFVVPAVNSTVRIIVDDIEGMPATQCFTNGDYIRFRAFNRTSGLTIANVWGTVTLDATYGTNGFSNGTQAYTFTCKATSGAGLTVFKGSEVLDYGTSGSGLIARTTLDAQGSPYEQIATWESDPSVASNYTVHARLGNIGGIANCNGYGIYTDNGFLTGKITVGDLTKSNHYLDFSNGLLTVKGNIYLASGYAAVSTFDMNSGISLAVNNIQVGGRNLLKGTNGDYRDFRTLGSWSINSSKQLYTNNNNYSQAITVAIDTSINKQFVLSFDALVQTSNYICNYEKYSNGATISAQVMSNGHNVMKIVAPSDVNSIQVTFCGTSTTSGPCTIYNIQLENGNKETAYNVAPEDIDAEISLKVSSTDYNGNNISSLINQTATTIQIQASKINLVGAVTFNSFTTDVQNTINGKADSAAHGNFTYIDGNSVYTGTLTANQVNAVGINASSITTGTLSADRIAANTITGDKINATSVSASIATVISLDASQITTGTLSADRIAANSIDASKIIANSITSTQINSTSVSVAIASVISLDASRITTGTLGANRIDSVSVVANGIAAQTINAQNATFENLNVTSATMYNGTIYNLRSPWISAADDLTSIATDNSIMTNASGSGYQLFTLDWTVASSGRSIQLISRGSTTIGAANNMWFYVNGNRVKNIYLTDEIVELVGYGGSSIFFGWIVKKRTPLMGYQQYGKPLNILAHGVVTVTSSTSINLNYKMFNGGYIDGTLYTMSVSRLSEGLYRISFPTQWGLGANYMVITTGYGQVIFGTENNHPSKATIKTIADGYFDVWVSDDSSVNDGSFAFQMFNMNDI